MDLSIVGTLARHAFLILVFSNSAWADTLDQDAMGSGSLRSLLRKDPMQTMPQSGEVLEKQPYFILTPPYGGSVSLAYHRGALEGGSDKKRAIRFDAFTRATAHYDEPDCPLPRLPMIVEFTKDIWGKPTIGEIAFLSRSIPSVGHLSGCRTFRQLKSAVPNLVSIFDEDDAHAGFWYNWFKLTDEGEIEVLLLKATHEESGNLPKMEIWTGTLDPAQTSALADAPAVRPALQYVTVGGNNVRNPGRIIWTPDLTLMAAIAASGGTVGNPIVYIIRGKQRTLIRLQPVRSGKAPDPVLQPGDEIQMNDGTF